jgi:hypothetical protein
MTVTMSWEGCERRWSLAIFKAPSQHEKNRITDLWAEKGVSDLQNMEF